jgi:hypothetical protein
MVLLFLMALASAAEFVGPAGPEAALRACASDRTLSLPSQGEDLGNSGALTSSQVCGKLQNPLPPCGGGLGWGAAFANRLHFHESGSFFNRDLAPASSPVTEALREGKYPWYDADADRVQPVWPARMSAQKWLRKRVKSILEAIGKFFDRFKFDGGRGLAVSGDMIATVLLLATLVAFFFFLVMLWIRRQGGPGGGETDSRRLGNAARLNDLPEGIRPGDGDPWEEAQRRRASGDLSGAIVSLFAHQLLTLDQLGLIRLAPGKTGRHYLQGLRDRDFIDALGATLRLFEDVYYGRRSPTREAFESVWKHAQMFQQRRRVLAGAQR